jgi:2-polyprenyl-6-methoxyphenol hydroxylase-like FAD-dependent oxidoreductase
MTPPPDYDVLVVGGGPVGLLLGNLLGLKGLRTLVIEKNPSPPEQSMAIGITPPSLDLFHQLDLDALFVENGTRVDLARVHEGQRLVGELRFHSLASPYPFILAIPQATTIELLEERLNQAPLVTFRRECCLSGFEQGPDRVTASILRNGDPEAHQLTASFLVGCDGHRSQVREAAGIKSIEEKNYLPRFLMADFADTTDLGSAAHLFFSRHGSIESFPLPGNRRRWIIQADRLPDPPEPAHLVDCVERQTGYDLKKGVRYSASVFSVRRFVCQSYFRDRVVLCGDAAHVMSPIGGQGMNTGFADAEFLADALARHCRGGEDFHRLFADYDRLRRIAFKVAADRAERGMWLGTRCGRLASALRFLFIKSLLSPFLSKALPPYFAMLTIPYRSLAAAGSEWH